MTIPVVHQSPRNPRAAIENRRTFDAAGVVCVNLTGAAGTGKTSLLEAILPRIRDKLRVGVITSDLATTRDAQRLAPLGVPVVQLLTDGACHLRADHVRHALAEMPLHELELLLIENVGSLVCQARNDLGEHARVALLSATGGDGAATKHPAAFATAALILLTKCDLLGHVEFDVEQTLNRLRRVNPYAEIVYTDTRKRVGIDRVAGWLLGYVRAHHVERTSRARASEPVPVPT